MKIKLTEAWVKSRIHQKDVFSLAKTILSVYNIDNRIEIRKNRVVFAKPK